MMTMVQTRCRQMEFEVIHMRNFQRESAAKAKAEAEAKEEEEAQALMKEVEAGNAREAEGLKEGTHALAAAGAGCVQSAVLHE